MNPLRSKDGRSILPMDLSTQLQRRVTSLACHRPGTAKRKTKLPSAPGVAPIGGSDAVAYKPVATEP